jgi:hypothetical protein
VLILLGEVIGTLGVVVAALLLAVLTFALVPPSDLLRRAALPIARKVLGHQRLFLGKLSLSPLEGIELQDLWLGAPSGYALPLVTVKRVVVRYDLSQILRGEVRVREVQVERPVVRVEEREGKLNWMAFLEGLPKSEPKPEEKSEPPDLQVWVDRVSVIGLGAFLDDGKEKVALDSLHLGVTGFYSRKRSHFDVAVRLEGRDPNEASVSLLRRSQARGETALGGRFLSKVKLDLSVDRVEAPRVGVDLAVEVASVELRSAWQLDPVRLALRLKARADVPGQRAEVDQLSVAFNGAEILALQASLEGLTTASQQVKLLLSKLHLPLDRFAPYARAVVTGVDFGGDLEVRDLRLTGAVDDMVTQRRLPRLSGTVSMDQVWARVARSGQRAEIKDLGLRLVLAAGQRGKREITRPHEILAALPALTARPAASALAPTERPVPSVALLGRLRLGQVRASGAEVRDVDLRFASGAHLVRGEPRAFGARVSLALPAVHYRHPTLGPLQVSLRTSLEGSGDLGQKTATLDRFELALDDLLKVRLAARVTDLDRRPAFAAELKVEPMDLARLLARVPAALRAPLGRARLVGRVGISLKAKGRAPAPRTPPLRLPVELDGRIALEGVSLDDPERALVVSKLGGEITIQGKPSDLHLGGALDIGALRKPDQRVAIQGVRLPLALHLTPASLEAKLGLRLSQIQKEDLGLAAKGLDLSAAVTAAVPVEQLVAGKAKALPLGPTSVKLGLGWDALRISRPGATLALGPLKTTVDAAYDGTRPEAIQVLLKTRLQSVRHADLGATLRDLSLELSSGVTGPVVRLPQVAPEDLRLKRATARLKLEVGTVDKRDVLVQPLRKTSLAAEGSWTGDGDLDLRRLALRVPSRGVVLDLSGTVKNALSAGIGPLPPFDVTVSLDLDNPKTHDPARASFLFTGLWGAGQAGVTLRARRLSADRVELEGRLRARDFNLWTRGASIEDRAGEGMLRKETRLHLRDVQADVPFSQELLVRLPQVALPRPSRSIFDSQAASALYRAFQPYTGGRSRLSIGGIIFDEQLTAMSREGYFLSAVKRRTAVDRVSLDLRIADGTLHLSRLYVKLFGGDIAGEVQAQVLGLDPLDFRARLRTQVTGVNLAYLNPAAKERTAKTEVSALLDGKYWYSRQLVEGRVDITRLSLDLLDALLAYLDPNKVNESVQSNRKLINGSLVKWVNPKVKLVAIWINYGNLNMDIDMDAWSLAGTYLKSTLKNMRIRRLSILRFLPPGGQAKEETTP